MKTKSRRIFGFWFDNLFKIILNKTIRNLFVLPRACITTFPSYICARKEEKAFFGFYIHSIDYKNKFGEWRFEQAPYIQLNLFGYAFKLVFNCPFPDDEICECGYWEAILDIYCNYAYNGNNNFNLYKVLENNTWTNRDGEKENMTRTLTRYGLKRYYYDKGLFDVFYEKYGVNK